MNTRWAAVRCVTFTLVLVAAMPLPAADPSPAPSGFGPTPPFPIPLSAGGPDQLMSAAPGPDGSFYAAGFAAQTVTGPRNVVVVKITAAGTLDTGFGVNGIAFTSLVFVGGLDEIDIVVQDGKPVVGATIDNTTIFMDRDIALTRLNTNGALDGTFGVAGVRVLNLNDALDQGSGPTIGRDAIRGLALGPDGSLFLHALQRGEGLASGGGPRTDTDFTVVKLTPNGSLDTAWGDQGKFLLDIEEANATPRALHVLGNGRVIASGYANTPSLGSPQPVLYKLTASGILDTGFATDGVYHETVLLTQTEIYGFAVHGDNLVTAGYGRESGDTNDYISMRFSVSEGERDLTWGGAPNGVVIVDPSGMLLSDNCRNAVALPEGRTAMIGSAGPNLMPEQDAVYVILNADGELDADFEGGIGIFEFGSNGADQFWGGAYNAGKALFVGFKGAGITQTPESNDDAYALLLSVPDDVIFRNGFQ